jgi:hypothetical protein
MTVRMIKRRLTPPLTRETRSSQVSRNEEEWTDLTPGAITPIASKHGGELPEAPTPEATIVGPFTSRGQVHDNMSEASWTDAEPPTPGSTLSGWSSVSRDQLPVRSSAPPAPLPPSEEAFPQIITVGGKKFEFKSDLIYVNGFGDGHSIQWCDEKGEDLNRTRRSKMGNRRQFVAPYLFAGDSWAHANLSLVLRRVYYSLEDMPEEFKEIGVDHRNRWYKYMDSRWIPGIFKDEELRPGAYYKNDQDNSVYVEFPPEKYYQRPDTGEWHYYHLPRDVVPIRCDRCWVNTEGDIYFTESKERTNPLFAGHKTMPNYILR